MLFKALIVIVFVTSAARASEDAHGGGPPAPAAEGQGANAAPGGVTKETLESGRQSMEWVDLVNKVSAAKAKVEAQRSVMVHLLEQKKSIDKQEALSKHVAVMTEENKKLHKMIDEYEEQRNLLQYRFPEKGIKELRKYERVEKKSLEEFETELSVEGQLQKTVSKMKKQFKTPPEPKAKNPEEAIAPVTSVKASGKKKPQPKKVEEADSITNSIKIIK